MDGSFSSCDPEQPAHSLRAVRRGTILFLVIRGLFASRVDMHFRDSYVIVVDRLICRRSAVRIRMMCHLAGMDLRHGHGFFLMGMLPFFRATFSDGDKATLHVSFPGAALRPNRQIHTQIKLMNTVMTRLLRKSANRLPTSGISRYALTDGAYFSHRACMLAMALGVAPMPKPQVPDTMTAAS